MKKKILLFFLVLSNGISADEPPCWCEFSIKSDNNLFRAEIEFVKKDSLLKPWRRDWTIKVYENNVKSKLKWSSIFHQDGYGGGTLSNDGKIYIYVNDWLDMNIPPNQVVIYMNNNTIRYSGKDLNLNPNNFSHTESHQIWMKNYKLIPNKLSDSTILKINTNNDREIIINLKKTLFNDLNKKPDVTNETNFLIHLSVYLVFFTGIVVILFILFRKRKRA